MNKKFILGVGAQKSGTTWLHYYLSSQSFSDFGFQKEYHVFDAIDLRKENKGNFNRVKASVSSALQEDALTLRACNQIRLINFILNPDSYFDYFASRFLVPDIRLTGDITPAYAALSADVFKTIDTELRRRGVTVFPFFLMRDPVYRLQSQVRMSLRNRPLKAGKATELSRMERLLRTPTPNNRLRYHETITNLYTAFGEERPYLNLYEALFTQSTAQQIADYLDLDLGPPPISDHKNVSRTPHDLTKEEYMYFRGKFTDVYDAVGELTDLDIDTYWRFREH